MSKPKWSFQRHPIELSQRRARCRPLVQIIQELEFETINVCNVCGSDHSILISDIDRYGLPVRSAMCAVCGLVYLVDRLSRSGYQNFYEQGIYRDFISAYKGVIQTPQKILEGQKAYTSILIKSLDGYLGGAAKGKLLLDIGGSTGLISKEFEKSFGYKATILEPAPAEAKVSQAQGLSVEIGSIENWSSDKKFDLILLCRTFEHIIDLEAAFKNVRKMLTPDGLFFCDVADFSVNCALYGPPASVTQIDHCFWLSHQYAPLVFERLGFEVMHTFINLPDYQVGYLLRPFDGERQIPMVSELIIKDVEKYLEYQRVWNNCWHEYYDFKHWAKIRLYQWKKRLPFFGFKDNNFID